MCFISATLLAAPPREVPIRLINGRPCALGMIAGPAGSFPANFVIELGLARPLVLHERTARSLGLSPDGTVTITIGEVALKDVPVLAAEIAALEALSRDFAEDLQEIPAVGFVGLPALGDVLVELELTESRLRLLDPTGQSLSADDRTEMEGDSLERRMDRRRFGAEVELAYEERDGAYWLLASGPDGFPLSVRLSTVQPYTMIDREVAEFFEAPAGDVSLLKLGRIDVTRFVALRPHDLGDSGSPPAQLILGTDLLGAFRLTLDPQRKRLLLQQVAEAAAPEPEREYYRLRETGDAGAIQSWIETHTGSRLAQEAAELLMTRLLAQEPTDEAALQKGLALWADTLPVARRSGILVATADELLAGTRRGGPGLARAALDLAEKYAEHDLNARAVHDIQARRGQMALNAGNVREARRQLLAAAFGLPRDPQVNLWMGMVYERMGKPARAWSRYVQALLADEELTDAKRGLDRLHHDSAFRAAFRVEDAAQMLEGRVPSFYPGERYRPPQEPAPADAGHLVELFTSIDDADTAAAELAIQGLADYFRGAPVVIVAHHVATAQPDPLANDFAHARAAFYEVAATPAAIFDGGMRIERSGSEADAGAVFDEYRFGSEMFEWGRADWRIAGAAKLEGDSLHVALDVSGPEQAGHLRLFAVLCERAVLVPGASGIYLHYHVARHALTPADGLPITAGADSRRHTWTIRQDEVIAACERSVRALEEKTGFSFYIRPTYVTLAECDVAAFVQDAESRQVLAAIRLTPQETEQP